MRLSGKGKSFFVNAELTFLGKCVKKDGNCFLMSDKIEVWYVL